MKIANNKIKSLRQILNIKAKGSDGIRLTFTAYKQGEERGIKLIEKADIKNLSNINKLLMMDNFIRVKIDVFDMDINESKPEKTYEYTDEQPAFSGFGDISEFEHNRVNELLNARLREQDYQRLQTENQSLKSRVDELESDLEDAEEAIEQMGEKIKSQQGLKTYAELAGIALERLGLKNQVKGVLSGFLGDEQPEQIPAEALESDQSGIVETTDFSGIQPRNELAELINSCLYAMDNSTLGIVFSIFSEIEKNPALALQILTMINKPINNYNQFNDENDK